MTDTKPLTGIGLADFGLIHVTGLPCGPGLNSEMRCYAVHNGVWYTNDGITMVVTIDFEVWVCPEENPLTFYGTEYRELLQNLCPHRKSMRNPLEYVDNYDFVSFILTRDMLRRVSNPKWEGDDGKAIITHEQRRENTKTPSVFIVHSI